MDPREFDSKQEEHPLDEFANADLESEAFTPFNSAELRLKFQETSQQQQSAKDHKQRQMLILRAIMIIVLGLALLAAVVWAGNIYSTVQLERQAALTAEALAAKYQNAERFMNAGRPEEALRLYGDIQQIDPAYKDLDQKIQMAKESMIVMDLYQQGAQFFRDGKSDKALEILLRVEKLHPKYKDTLQLIQKIEQEKQIAALVKEIKNLYSRGDWVGVVRDYEAIQAIDPFVQLPELQDTLFNSYRQLIIDLAERNDLTLEDIQTAEKYYRIAIALVPQDKGYAKERDELRKIAGERLANKYYLNAINLLESSNYSVKGVREAIRILTQADNIGSKSPAIEAEIEKAQLFLDSYYSLSQHKWDDAISGLEALRRKEDNYAGGRVKYFLYEAYTARGDMLFAYADFGGAFSDYQEAEKFAWDDEKNLLRLFQIEARVAAVLGKFERFQESAEFYHYAFARVGYQKRLASPEDQGLLDMLNQAELAYEQADNAKAVRLYEAAMKQQVERLYDQKTVVVKQDDTLANVAFENGSTIESLRTANDFGESLIVNKDRELLVPVMLKNNQ